MTLEKGNFIASATFYETIIISLSPELTGQHGSSTIQRWDTTEMIYLINGYRVGRPVLPTGMGYIAQAIEDAGINYDVCDVNILSNDQIVELIAGRKPEFVGLGTMTFEVEKNYQLLLTIKTALPNAIIIMGGPHAIAAENEIFQECSAIDIVIQGEGEESLVKLMSGIPLQEISGVLTRNPDNNGPTYGLLRIDKIAFPKYRKFDLGKYGVTMNIASSRGCVYKCTFCGAPKFLGKKWRAFSAAKMIEEFEYWYIRGYRNFYFSDSLFALDKRRVIEFCTHIINADYRDTVFTADGARADHLSLEVLQQMKKANFRSLTLGVESVNNKTLEFFQKNETFECINHTISLADSLGFDITIYLIVGAPLESYEDTLRSIHYPLTYKNIVNIIVTKLLPIKGTPFYEYALQHNMVANPNLCYPAIETAGFNKKNDSLTPVEKIWDELLPEVEIMKNFINVRNELKSLFVSQGKNQLDIQTLNIAALDQLVTVYGGASPLKRLAGSIYSWASNCYITNMLNQVTEHPENMKTINIDKITTHLTPDEKDKLQELAMITKGHTFVELGSYLGASSCYIASGIQSTGKSATLFCVDTWANEGMAEGSRDTYNEFLDNTASYKDIIVPLRGKSDNISKKFKAEIDFLFVDAGHDYENVKADVLGWFPKLRPGAQVIFHDIGWAEGVQQVVREYVQQFAHNEGSLPNMYWACISQSGYDVSIETLSSLNQQRDPNNLIQRLLAVDIPVEKVDLDVEAFISWLSDYREIHDRYSRSNDVFIEKCLEHYIAWKFSTLKPEQLYIDIAAAGSNWTDCLLTRGINAYSLDLSYPEGIHGNKIGANAAATGLPDNSVDAMSLQCAFETFRGDYDTLFIRESRRILKYGGKVVITPLYLDARHFILSSKNTDLSTVPLDEGALRVWREDEYDEPFSRHYSPESLADRIFSNIEGLSAKMIFISNLDQFRQRFPGQRIYCDFNLYISKEAEPITVESTNCLSGIYDETFYDEQKNASYKSAESVVPLILDVIQPKSVIDIGCGVGGWLHVFQENGVIDIYGYDVNELAADKYFIDKNRIRTNSDLSNNNFKIPEKSDLLICLEVAEHLPAEVADKFILNLTKASPIVVFSAALPGQTGVNHINEQPPWYWREKFNKLGYTEIDFIRPQILRNEEVCWWYRQNITCFVRPDVLTANPKLASLAKLHGQRNDGHKLTIVNEWVLKHIFDGEHLPACSTKPQNIANSLLSVIIPTCNRAALLYNTLESLTLQTYLANRFEVIVVDNGSTDSTAEVCKHFEQRIPYFKCIYDPRPGLHNGRHTGLDVARGDILVYADDDIEAMPTWLEGVAESFADLSVAMVGGKILPKFEIPPPEWVDTLRRRTDSGWSLGWYSILDFGDTTHEIQHEYVWGCNFSIRKEVLNKVGGFHPDSVPQDLIKYRGDGESAVSIAVRDMGLKAIYNPKASVYHVVSTNRLTVDYIYQRAFNQGISNSYTSIRKNLALSAQMQYAPPSNTIHEAVDRGMVDGFNYHQQMVQADGNLQEWVLRENYFGESGTLQMPYDCVQGNTPNVCDQDMRSNGVNMLPSFLCFKPFTTVEIHTDGSCKFCCYIGKKIGNIKEGTLESIFNSEAAQEIRKKFYQKDYSDCDKNRCSLFASDNGNSMYEIFSENDPLYRSDINESITSYNTVIESGPSRIIESVHGLCNVTCKFCWPFERYSQHSYSNEIFQLLIDGSYNVREIHLAGGEPFYNPLINELLIKLIERKISLSVTSNLTCIMDTTKSLLERVQLRILHASINAASKNVYDQLVQGGDWDKVCNNLDYFKTLKIKGHNFIFGISMVVTRINYKEIINFIDFGINQYSVDYIALYQPDEVHIPDSLKLTISDAYNILEILNNTIFNQNSNKINFHGLRNHVMRMIK